MPTSAHSHACMASVSDVASDCTVLAACYKASATGSLDLYMHGQIDGAALLLLGPLWLHEDLQQVVWLYILDSCLPVTGTAVPLDRGRRGVPACETDGHQAYIDSLRPLPAACVAFIQ